MSNFTQLENNTPVVTPAKSEIVWDKLWIDMLTMNSTEVNKITLYCKLVPCRDLENSEKELKPDLKMDDVKSIRIENVWDILSTNPKFGMAMELIFQSVKDYGIEQGILKSDVIPVEPSEEPIIEPELPIEPVITPNIDESYLIIDNSTSNKFEIIHINNLGEYAGVHHLEILCKKVNDLNIN